MNGRTAVILGRFPAHFEATREDKQLARVAQALATDMEVLAADMAAVRRAHRIGHADTKRDLLYLGGLHGISLTELGILLTRLEAVRKLALALQQAVADGDDGQRDDCAETLLDLWGVLVPSPVLSSFAPDAADLNQAALTLAAQARSGVAHQASMDAIRTRILRIGEIHAAGNGTISALLRGCANALDLDLDLEKNVHVKGELIARGVSSAMPEIDDDLFHSNDRFLHSSFVRDRLTLEAPTPTDGSAAPTLSTREEIVGLEENPLQRTSTGACFRKHADLFAVTRRGFTAQLLRIEITGIANRTIHPQLVNRDDGHGFGFFGTVPDGQTLTLDEEGHLILKGDDASDVTSFAYSWKGGCFASAASPHERDFVFDGPGRDPSRRPATFVMTTPPTALDRETVFPLSALGIDTPDIGLGTTRYAFFVQTGYFSSTEHPPEATRDYRVTPLTKTAFAGASVFAEPPLLSDPYAPEHAAASVALSWLEHRAFAARLHIPPRFKLLDTEDFSVPAQVLAAIERFRPVGIALEVVYQDDKWILGHGVIPGDQTGDPNSVMLGGTALWPGPDDEDSN